mgnify:CR=1 FL=1
MSVLSIHHTPTFCSNKNFPEKEKANIHIQSLSKHFPTISIKSCRTKIKPQTTMEMELTPTKKRKVRVVNKWTVEEDTQMLQLVHTHGTKSWGIVASLLTGRSGKQCRERFHNQLDTNIKKCPWTKEEEELLMHLHRQYGNRWAQISQHIEGRTDNSIKVRLSFKAYKLKIKNKLTHIYLTHGRTTSTLPREGSRACPSLAPPPQFSPPTLPPSTPIPT